MDEEQFNDDPREYVMELIESGLVSYHAITIAFLNYLSYEDIKDCMEAYELSPEHLG